MKLNTVFVALILIVACTCVSWAEDAKATSSSDSTSISTLRRLNITTSMTDAGMQSTNGKGMTEINGSVPEPTHAEELQQLESEFNKRMTDLTATVDILQKRINDAKRQADPPAQEDLEYIDRNLTLAEKELGNLESLGVSQIAQTRCADMRDRLFNLRLSEDIMKRRWGGETSVFGLDFFQNANVDLLTTQRNSSPNYKIRVGDKLRFLVVSSLGAQNDYLLKVDKSGCVTIAGMGRVSVAGRSVSQVESLVSSKISSRFRQLRAKITVEEMSSIQVQVSGEVARPGTYTLNGMATVFDALCQAGGPTKSATFRHISLVRDGQPKRNIDLYSFLLSGSKNQDKTLEDHDLIFVAPVGPTVVVEGEVIRPGRYEPGFPVTLAHILKMAGGAKSTGNLQNVQVERVQNSQYKVLLSEPIKGGDKEGFVLQPGDTVTVTSVRKDRTNQVSIEGAVASPGLYGFRDGMHVAELIKLAQGLSDNKEVYRDRADILRIDSLKGTQIISFNLGKALQGDAANNVALTKLDRIFIYEPDQVIFRPKLIMLQGAVARPGTYKRTGGMRINDAIAAAGGVMPQTYLTRADLIRHKSGSETELIKIDLQSALNGDPDSNVNLEDRDELTLYSQSEVQWQDHSVRIEGAVQRQGVYVRSDNMRLSDLIFVAGGLLPEAEKKAEVARCAESGTSCMVKVDLAGLQSGNDNDILLQDRDVITIAAINPHLRQPEIVYLTGEVAKPGPYALNSQDEKLDDLIARAGGLTGLADRNGMLFLRQKESFENHQQEQDSDIILQKSKMFADKQMMIQLAKMGVTTAPESMLKLKDEGDDKTSKPANVVSDKKLEQQVDASGAQIIEATDQPSANVDASNVSAMGLPIDSNKKLASSVFKGEGIFADLMDSARISVNFSKALDDPHSPDNMPLRNGDRIFIPKKTNVVTVIGAVLHPHSFAAGPGSDVSYYIQRSGGYASDAESRHVVVVRANGDALPQSRVKSVEPGDMIVVPTTGIIDVAKKWENVGSITKVISDVLSTAYILTRF